MFSIQISDRATFTAKAKAVPHPVQVVRAATMIPMAESGGVVMRPAVTIDYSLTFDDPRTGATRWTFREVLPTDDNGEVILSDSLWGQLARSNASSVNVLHRSGSF